MASPAVQVDRLTHSYGSRIALHELSLTVQSGEIVALLGPNGSGKTTLFRVLSTLVAPQDGTAKILGLDVATTFLNDPTGRPQHLVDHAPMRELV